MIYRIRSLLNEEQTAAAQAFARSSDFVDGKATNLGTQVKKNQQIDQTEAEKSDVGDMIVRALFAHPRVARTAFPKTIPQPTFSRYEPGMYYGPHLDEAMMATRPRPLRSDLSATVFLSAPDEYEGGELELWLGSEHALVKMFLAARRLVPFRGRVSSLVILGPAALFLSSSSGRHRRISSSSSAGEHYCFRHPRAGECLTRGSRAERTGLAIRRQQLCGYEEDRI